MYEYRVTILAYMESLTESMLTHLYGKPESPPGLHTTALVEFSVFVDAPTSFDAIKMVRKSLDESLMVELIEADRTGN